MDEQIETAVKRGRAYWFADGFTEILGGIFLILVSSVIFLRGIDGQAEFLPQFASTAVDIGLVKLAAFLAIILAIWWLKDRFTYPRTGVVQGKRIMPGIILTFIRNVILAAILPVLGLLAGFVFVPSFRGVLASIPAWLPILVGILWGVLFYSSGEWMGLRRFRIMGGLTLLAGLGVGAWQALLGFPSLAADALQADWLQPMPEAMRASLDELLSRLFVGMSVLSTVTGVILIIAGSATFLLYRRENPFPYREEE
ncbi:MAG: hypothetical protein JW929_01540 [Anaerolineales bacterium]|nr:hypothetical protein [Anaerolineales bacterium]